MASLTKFIVFFLAVVLALLLLPTSAEIKKLTISDDDRSTILFEKFGFLRGGEIYVSISGVASTSVSGLPPPDGSLLGFFLLPASSGAIPSSSSDPCILHSLFAIPLFNFHDLSSSNSFESTFTVDHADEYSLYFANCAAPDTRISMSVITSMYNTGSAGKDYLPAGLAPAPAIFAAFAVAYAASLLIWLFVTLYKNRSNTHSIHHVMSALLLARALYLISAAEDQHYIRVTGTAHGWDVAFYLFQLIKGVLLFIVIVLIGTGWSFLKPFLQVREKRILIAVIPLQILANIASAIVGETGPFLPGWFTWSQVFLLVDIACCCAVLLPIIWSIRSLRETSKTDGKAARTLAKLTLFRQFYVVVMGYLYFTRIVVYAFETITSYKYRWVSIFVEEAVSMAFYGYMFYTFRPVERNQYLALDEEEEELAEARLRAEEFEL